MKYKYCQLTGILYQSIGIEVFIEDYGKIGVKVLLLATTCDLPARAAVLNFTQFNGFYGCCRCKQKGNCLVSMLFKVMPYNFILLGSVKVVGPSECILMMKVILLDQSEHMRKPLSMQRKQLRVGQL